MLADFHERISLFLIQFSRPMHVVTDWKDKILHTLVYVCNVKKQLTSQRKREHVWYQLTIYVGVATELRSVDKSVSSKWLSFSESSSVTAFNVNNCNFNIFLNK